jgi:hypothetical protein
LQAFYAHANAIQITPYNQDFGTSFPAFTPAGDRWAVAALSADVTSENLNEAGDSFRFVAIDGILPSIENVVNGFYPYFDSVLTYTITSGQDVPSGDSLAAWNAIVQGAVNTRPLASDSGETTLSDIDTAYATKPWGDGGDLGLATLFVHAVPVYASLPVTHAEVLQNPIDLWTKASSGSVNNCGTPQLYGNLNAGISLSTPNEGAVVGTGNVNH